MDLREEVRELENVDELVEAVKTDYRDAPLSAVDRAILDYACKLTLTPAEMSEADIEALRQVGLDDASIHDVVQVAALFNYYDRLADGLGIEPEPEFPNR